MYQHAHFYHVTNEYLVLKSAYFMISEYWTFGLQNLFVRTREPFFSNLRTFGLKNLRTPEPSNLRTFGLIGCNQLYNVSVETETVISDWKLSKVTPIYKGKGSKDEAGNYRPISLISHIMKIFEKEIKLQVMGYLEVNNLITSDQSAYRNQHNTQTALHRVVDDWLDNVSDGNLTGVCSFDITKCFDTINHAILLKKMYFLWI